MPVWGLGLDQADRRPDSARLAEVWAPYVEEAVAAFGADRCMFESNFPIDRASCDYRTLWNGFKRIARTWSNDEKRAAFSGTAARIYRMELP